METDKLIGDEDEEFSDDAAVLSEAHELRGPSLSELCGLGIDVRDLESGDRGNISFRNVDCISPGQQLDNFKSVQNSPSSDSTDMKEIIQTGSRTEDQTISPLVQIGNESRVYYSSRREESTETESRETDVLDDLTPPTGRAPALSEGKKYHVFFSYESSDLEWVKETVSKLESPEYGFKCSIHERDFHAGKRIIENITDHIRSSEKTVLVLSPDFLQSRWCHFEVELGVVMSMEESKLLVVPVMIRQCQIPDSIKTLTYIDATGDSIWWPRFIDAILSQGELSLF